MSLNYLAHMTNNFNNVSSYYAIFSMPAFSIAPHEFDHCGAYRGLFPKLNSTHAQLANECVISSFDVAFAMTMHGAFRAHISMPDFISFSCKGIHLYWFDHCDNSSRLRLRTLVHSSRYWHDRSPKSAPNSISN